MIRSSDDLRFFKKVPIAKLILTIPVKKPMPAMLEPGQEPQFQMAQPKNTGSPGKMFQAR